MIDFLLSFLLLLAPLQEEPMMWSVCYQDAEPVSFELVAVGNTAEASLMLETVGSCDGNGIVTVHNIPNGNFSPHFIEWVSMAERQGILEGRGINLIGDIVVSENQALVTSNTYLIELTQSTL